MLALVIARVLDRPSDVLGRSCRSRLLTRFSFLSSQVPSSPGVVRGKSSISLIAGLYNRPGWGKGV